MEPTPPTDLKARLDQLSPAQRALLQQRLGKKAAAAPPADRIPRRTETGPCVLSFPQQRLWFLDQLSPGTSTYNVPYAMEILGDIDVAALGRALELIVARHEVLRTVFPSVDGRPMQVALSQWPPVLQVTDLSGEAPAQRETAAEHVLRVEAARPFQLDRDLMLRAVLLRLARQRSIFLHVSHHIAWDYRSRVVLYEELAQAYAALSRGEAPHLPELPLQYADFAVWHRQRLEGAELEQLAAYWKGQLGSAPPSLDLPTDHPRPPVQSQRGAKYFFAMPRELIERAKVLSRAEGVTLYMTLLATFKTFLFFLTGQESISVGSPIAGRNHEQTEPLIGFFINTLVLHTKLSPELTFRQVLGRVKQVTLGAYAHQDLPFEKLVEVLRPPRDVSRNPLFQVNFRVATGAAPALQLAALTVTPLELIDTASSKFDLAVEIGAAEGCPSYCEYSTDLFARLTVERLCQDVEQVLAALLSQPDTSLQELAVGQAMAERRQAGNRAARPRLGSFRRKAAGLPQRSAENDNPDREKSDGNALAGP